MMNKLSSSLEAKSKKKKKNLIPYTFHVTVNKRQKKIAIFQSCKKMHHFVSIRIEIEQCCLGGVH